MYKKWLQVLTLSIQCKESTLGHSSSTDTQNATPI